MPASIKSINPVQEYPILIESYAYVLKLFTTTIDLSIIILISFGISSPPKLWKQLTLFNAYKAIQWFRISEYSSRFIELIFIKSRFILIILLYLKIS